MFDLLYYNLLFAATGIILSPDIINNDYYRYSSMEAPALSWLFCWITVPTFIVSLPVVVLLTLCSVEIQWFVFDRPTVS